MHDRRTKERTHMGASVAMRFYAELNDFLPEHRRFTDFEIALSAGETVRGLLDDCGVPPGAVDLVLLNGEPQDLDHPIGNGDRVSVYPVFETLDLRHSTKVRATPLRRVRFVLDVHLGKLAAHLRMLGFDTLYRATFTDSELVRISLEEERTLLSRDRALTTTRTLTRVYRVDNTRPREQLLEVLRRFDLFGSFSPFTRCMACNTILEVVPKEELHHRLPPRVAAGFTEFQRCPTCARIYWRGSHYRRMEAFIESLHQAAS
jgi:uncharacterized protein with PIN domain/sulfur carrier protein ThiS